MSHVSHHMGASRANCPNHDGTAQAIRDALARSSDPLSVHQLQLATGIKAEKIRGALSQMVNRTGSVVSMHVPKGVVYALYIRQEKPARKPTGSGQIAGRIVYPQYRYGSSRLP